MEKIIKLIFLAVAVFVTFLFFLASRSSKTYDDQLKLIGFPNKTEQSVIPNAKMKVTFLGVTTLLFDDGETRWMTDGFFSRPGRTAVLFKKIESDKEVVAIALKKLGVTSLDAVIPIHSHYDHALDASEVAMRTGATLIGSPSTANIGRGNGLTEKQIRTVQPGDVARLGKFKITFISAVHSPHGLFEGEISEPIQVPTRSKDYKMGECYSLLLEHSGNALLIHGSAGFIPNSLDQVKADVIYLGIGTLGMQSKFYKEEYWKHVVTAVGAKRVITVHWDDFFKPLDAPLTPQKWPIDSFDDSLDFLISEGIKNKVDVRIPIQWETADPFYNLGNTK